MPAGGPQRGALARPDKGLRFPPFGFILVKEAEAPARRLFQVVFHG